MISSLSVKVTEMEKMKAKWENERVALSEMIKKFKESIIEKNKEVENEKANLRQNFQDL